MRLTRLAPIATAAALTIGLLASPAFAQAYQTSMTPQQQATTQQAIAGAQAAVSGMSAEQVRKALMTTLKAYPPSLGRILKQDSGLMQNAQYMAPYPALSQFLLAHPEVHRNPGYFFEGVGDSGYETWIESPEGQRQQAINAWRDIIQGFTFLLGFSAVVFALSWIIRSVIEHRRWSRLAKVQAEVHNKLIDRLASNDEMLAYIQSPAGAGFLKAGPTAVGGSEARAMHAPFGRILWSAQAGVVLLALGIGLRWVTVSAPNEVVEMLRFFGIIGQALGVGFLVSAGLAYVISRRMGLIDQSALRMERDTPSRS